MNSCQQLPLISLQNSNSEEREGVCRFVDEQLSLFGNLTGVNIAAIVYWRDVRGGNENDNAVSVP